jgi:hypothetical protein
LEILKLNLQVGGVRPVVVTQRANPNDWLIGSCSDGVVYVPLTVLTASKFDIEPLSSAGRAAGGYYTICPKSHVSRTESPRLSGTTVGV